MADSLGRQIEPQRHRGHRGGLDGPAPAALPSTFVCASHCRRPVILRYSEGSPVPLATRAMDGRSFGVPQDDISPLLTLLPKSQSPCLHSECHRGSRRPPLCPLCLCGSSPPLTE